MATQQQLLLLDDVETLGRSGEIVTVRPGYARNFLIPQGLAVPATKQTLRLQERLQEERRQRAIVDKSDSEALANRINGLTLVRVVKVDHDGRMYGSVSVLDIVELLRNDAQVEVDRKNIQLKHPIKETGVHTISLKLKEGVTASFTLKVMSEEGYREASQQA